MIRQRFSYPLVSMVWIFILVGCGAPATPTPIASPPTPLVPTATLTQIPSTPTSVPPTSTPVPPTVTPTSMPITNPSGAKAGHWAGEPSVSFEVTSEGNVRNFKMVFPMANGECHFDIKEVAIEEGDTFVYETLMAPDQIDEALLDFVKIVSGEPEVIKTDSGDMIVLQRIVGNFDDADTLTGTGKIWICETIFDGSTSKGIEWNAEWKSP